MNEYDNLNGQEADVDAGQSFAPEHAQAAQEQATPVFTTPPQSSIIYTDSTNAGSANDQAVVPLLLAQDLTKRYGHRPPALDHVNFLLPRGKIIGLLGPNGSGKTTFLKLACGLLKPNEGRVLINGYEPGVETKKAVSYLPEKTYLNDWMRVRDLINMFADFYEDFRMERALGMVEALSLNMDSRLKTLSKGNQEKIQLLLVMSRDADLYLLDEPIGGVDPAAREYILNTIIGNYSENATVLISTHLITDIETVLDEVIFLKNGSLMLHNSVDELREQQGKSIDQIFREVFRC